MYIRMETVVLSVVVDSDSNYDLRMLRTNCKSLDDAVLKPVL